MLRTCFCAVAVLSAAISSPAQAAWHEVKTRHFIIYADERPDRLQTFAAKLEKFDRAVRVARAMPDPNVGDGNRLTIFVLPDDAAVRRLLGDKGSFVAGYYIPRASGPVAFVPRSTDANDAEDLHAETVFFHEYAHHLMLQALDKPLPRWLVEGFAEFLSTARFPKDGSVVLGAAAMHRSWSLYDRENNMPFEKVLASSDGELNASEEDSIYALGWLLVHFLTFDPSRQGQLDRYVLAMSAGKSPLDSAREAFGDLRRLQSDVRSYLNRPRLKALIIGAEQIPPAAIQAKPLSPGAARIVMVRAQTLSGVNEKTAPKLSAQVRQIASQYPADEMVQVELAEAEMDAGNGAAAETAAGRALSLNPRNTDALVLKGRAIIEQAQKSDKDRAARFDQARQMFLAANKVDTEDPDPLYQFYRSFLAEGRAPTANAKAALHYASDLVPQDQTLRLNSAYIYLFDGRLAEARRALIPVAYDPHGGEAADMARSAIAKIDARDSKGAIAALEATGNGS